MSGIFKPGQLVSPLDWCDDPLPLRATSRATTNLNDSERVIGQLFPHDVALVIGMSRGDGSSVYVVGSHGSGWTYGGLLEILRDVS